MLYCSKAGGSPEGIKEAVYYEGQMPAVGAIASNCYLVWCEDTKEAMVIDPGGEGKRILDEIDKEGLKSKIYC